MAKTGRTSPISFDLTSSSETMILSGQEKPLSAIQTILVAVIVVPQLVTRAKSFSREITEEPTSGHH